MKKLDLMIATLVFLLLGVPASALAEAKYLLQPGDILEISVWQEPDLQRDVLVRPDGGISFPLVGEVDTTGVSVDLVAAEVSKRLEKYIPDTVVTVSLKQMAGNRIYVLGKVNRPGEFPLSRNVDVMQALSMAGGMTPFAASDEIQVLRREDGVQQSIAFNYSAVEKGSDLSQNIMLLPGDLVVVP
ncbi:MAG: polysaccharide export protein [Gammaproteobacteria bacterium]|nr:polysaccharide export protein [Gammaproteobacteria bacterium]